MITLGSNRLVRLSLALEAALAAAEIAWEVYRHARGNERLLARYCLALRRCQRIQKLIRRVKL